MLLSNTLSYAFKACEYLARQHGEDYVKTRIMSRDLGISTFYLAKILQQLKKAGLVNSRQGPNGGVRLSNSASGITVIEIIEAVNPAILKDTNGSSEWEAQLVESAVFGERVKKNGEISQTRKPSTLEDFVAIRKSCCRKRPSEPL